MNDYGFVHNGKVFTPNGTAVDAGENETRNKELEQRELETWKTQPDRFVAYFTFPADFLSVQNGRVAYRAEFRPCLTGANVKTWLGTKIGTITSARVWKNHTNQGRTVALSVTGDNGAKYYGQASWDNGTAVVLRKHKERKPRKRRVYRGTDETDLSVQLSQNEYQPKTGESCGCKKGVERDNCPVCEGTGQKIDFEAIRARRKVENV